eukprot:TRINITY_DN843_c0_g1_i2.p1 TRINITY_DN843_c0_g1~~TRINITY_DN843_c0_g1_i2.p1  ORF type:complete len:342 (+),score=99.46 TRINITY_DN843_c0_g1_i2:62-1087(+)
MLFVFALLVLCVVLFFLRKVTWLPRGYKAYSKEEVAANFPPSMKKADRDCTKDGIKKKEIPEDIDAIVIGSGMGGLYLAAVLAKVGWRVLVLEQHYIAGGCTHTFEDKGWEFDTGLHYVGKRTETKFLLDLVTANEEDKVDGAQMGTEENGYVYDEICLADDAPIMLRTGVDAWRAEMLKHFPEEEVAIRKWEGLVREVSKQLESYFLLKLLPLFLAKLLAPYLTKRYMELTKRTAWDVVSECTDNAKLRAALCGQCGDAGGPPDEASFMLIAGIISHYWKGGYYPVKGPKAIAEALIPTVERAGGRVFVRALVKKILLADDGKTAIGVEMKRGTRDLPST